MLLSFRIFTLTAAISALSFFSNPLQALELEEPQYTVIKQRGDVEIRQYKPYIIAKVKVQGDFDESGNKAFKMLGGYIFGDNKDNLEMAMTLPVSQYKAEEVGYHWVTFVMPSQFSMNSLPDPTNERVQLTPVDGGLMGAITYSGTWSQNLFEENKEKLVKELKEMGYQLTSDKPVFARYNSPLSLWFMRRNEVLVNIKTTST